MLFPRVLTTVRTHPTPHLFELELKLSRVKEKLKQDPWVVLGVVEHLLFNLTQPLVVWIIGYRRKKNKQQIHNLFTLTL